MIKKRTVFVLGAGASTSFGLYTGDNLVNEINKNLLPSPQNTHLNILQDMKFDLKFIEEFRKDLNYSGKMSIDQFLEHQPDYIPLGKIAIAQALIPREQTDWLFERKDNWYIYFFDKLNASFEEFDQNKISIITFNYDRTLEQFLFVALKSCYKKRSDQEIAEKIKKLQIIHVHGILGDLSWQSINGRPYSPELSIPALQKAADTIKIIYEENDMAGFLQAHKFLFDAEKIVFLGFGYHAINLERLEIANLDLNNKEIIGTAHELGGAEQHYVEGLFPNRKIDLDKTRAKVLTFLKEQMRFE